METDMPPHSSLITLFIPCAPFSSLAPGPSAARHSPSRITLTSSTRLSFFCAFCVFCASLPLRRPLYVVSGNSLRRHSSAPVATLRTAGTQEIALAKQGAPASFLLSILTDWSLLPP
jgi:hypothetical protein